MKYYTDDELIELVQSIGDSKESYEWVADKIAERFKNKDAIINTQRDRLDVAAKYVGHNLIYELLEEGY